jgi:hypothetical protein
MILVKKEVMLIEYGNGVMDNAGKFYPYRIVGSALSQVSTVLQPRNKQIRYFIRSAQFNLRTVAGDTTTYIGSYFLVDNEQIYITQSVIPSLAQVQINHFDVRVLCDLGSSLTFFCDVVPTLASINFLVAEIEGV